ncbi:MAG: cyclase family protein [Elusimicrobia bacterium]|nr:cyclase family protein [Elusimicrobiota bacterium]
MGRRPAIVDLSFPIREGMAVFPSHWHPRVEVVRLARHSVERRESRRLVLGTHTGTHVDAPRHFVPGGPTIDAFPLELMLGPARVVDLSFAKPRAEVGLGRLRKAAGPSGVRPRTLLRFGWSRRYGRADYFPGAPYLSLEACGWLADRGVRLLGLDTPSVDSHAHGRGSPCDAQNHRLLLGRGLFLVEALNNLVRLRREVVELAVLPLNVRNADGAPARCLAW